MIRLADLETLKRIANTCDDHQAYEIANDITSLLAKLTKCAQVDLVERDLDMPGEDIQEDYMVPSPTRTHRMQGAYQEGYDDGQLGMNENPYAMGTGHHKSYEEGNRAGRRREGF